MDSYPMEGLFTILRDNPPVVSFFLNLPIADNKEVSRSRRRPYPEEPEDLTRSGLRGTKTGVDATADFLNECHISTVLI